MFQWCYTKTQSLLGKHRTRCPDVGQTNRRLFMVHVCWPPRSRLRFFVDAILAYIALEQTRPLKIIRYYLAKLCFSLLGIIYADLPIIYHNCSYYYIKFEVNLAHTVPWSSNLSAWRNILGIFDTVVLSLSSSLRYSEEATEQDIVAVMG